jgi:hypothetical protein
MSNIINTLPINPVEFIKGNKGQFRAISKVRAGFLTTVDFRDFENESFSNNPANVLGYFKKGALQTVEFKAEGSDYWMTVFARVGKKIKLIDVDILKGLKVGTINSMWFNTELYSSNQYKAVNAKTWDSMAFVMNEEEMEMA